VLSTKPEWWLDQIQFSQSSRVFFVKLPKWWLDSILHRLIHTLHCADYNDLHHNFM
jgi:hypothetical protein